MKLVIVASLIMALATGAIAQSKAPAQVTSNPVVSTVRQLEERQSKNLIGAAEEMPADKYSYHPTKEQMTFGQSIAHIAEVNNAVCANVGELPAAAGPKTTEADSKGKLVAGLKASMAYCAQAFGKLSDAKLTDQIPFFGGRKITRLGAALEVNNDLIDHYAALAVYLRLNGLLPPTAQKKP